MPEYSDPAGRPRLPEGQAKAAAKKSSGELSPKIVRLYATPVEHRALESRIGNHRSLADLVRNFLEGDRLLGSPRVLPKRSRDYTKKKDTKVRITAAQKDHLRDAARAAQVSESEYLVSRLLALPEDPGHLVQRRRLELKERLYLPLHLATKRWAELSALIQQSHASDEVVRAVANLAEPLNQMTRELEQRR